MTTPQPLYPHTCDRCCHLGTTRMPEAMGGGWADWYACVTGLAGLGPSILWRWGAESHQYGSIPAALAGDLPEPFRHLVKAFVYLTSEQGLWPWPDTSQPLPEKWHQDPERTPDAPYRDRPDGP